LPYPAISESLPRTPCIWLNAADRTITDRILTTSEFADLPDTGKALVDVFLARTLAFNQVLMASLEQLGQMPLDIDSSDIYESLVGLIKHGEDRG